MPDSLVDTKVMSKSDLTTSNHINIPKLDSPIIGCTEKLSLIDVIPFYSKYFRRMLLECPNWLVVH